MSGVDRSKLIEFLFIFSKCLQLSVLSNQKNNSAGGSINPTKYTRLTVDSTFYLLLTNLVLFLFSWRLKPFPAVPSLFIISL